MARTKIMANDTGAPEAVGEAENVSAPSASVPGVGHNSYFIRPKPVFSFVKTGCTLLDCALGGGWALGRIVNVVGDKSTAKTALAVEALINFVREYPDGSAAYRDAEAAFDQPYAEAMGLPLEKVDFGDPDKPLITVEDFANDLEKFLGTCKGHGIYVLDSLDALTTEDELGRNYGDQGFGTAKAKLLSELFRKLTRKIEQSKVLVIIVSQVRDNIGAMFGEKHKRSGGRALDFYASQIVWLARMATLEKSVKKIKRAYGVTIRANVKKNKVGLPHRKCDFDFIFGYGIDDMAACLAFLSDLGKFDTVNIGLGDIDKMDEATYREKYPPVTEAVKKVWAEVDTAFLPTRKKYD